MSAAAPAPSTASGKTLLAIYAHPDDEAFSVGGTFAAFTDRGGVVTLVSATRGEAGEISDAELATQETLGDVREGELRDAMRQVGVSDIRFLGYRDSGMRGTNDNDDPRAFINADDLVLKEQLLEIIRAIGPDIVVTFGEDGIYGHPDHVKIHLATTAAFADYASDSTAGAEQARPMLYYTAVPRERMQEMAKRTTGPFVNMTPEELAQLGTPEDMITTHIDVSDQYDRKLAALLAHRSQFGPQGPLSELPAEMVREMLSTERFRRVPFGDQDDGRDPLGELLDAG